MSVCWTDSKQTIEDLLVVMKDDASVTAGFVNFLWFIDSSWALRHSWKTYISLWIWRKQSLAVYRTCLMLLCTGFSVIISACFWKDSQTNPSQGPETLKLALQWGLNIFIITGRGSHQQRESLPLRSALWDWMSWMHRWVHSEIQTKTALAQAFNIQIYLFQCRMWVTSPPSDCHWLWFKVRSCSFTIESVFFPIGVWRRSRSLHLSSFALTVAAFCKIASGVCHTQCLFIFWFN